MKFILLLVLGVVAVTAIPQDKLCPKDDMYTQYPDEANCRNFYICLYGKVVQGQCPSHMLYNAEALKCDSPANVKCTVKEPVPEKPVPEVPKPEDPKPEEPEVEAPEILVPAEPVPEEETPEVEAPEILLPVEPIPEEEEAEVEEPEIEIQEEVQEPEQKEPVEEIQEEVEEPHHQEPEVEIEEEHEPEFETPEHGIVIEDLKEQESEEDSEEEEEGDVEVHEEVEGSDFRRRLIQGKNLLPPVATGQPWTEFPPISGASHAVFSVLVLVLNAVLIFN